MKTIGVVGVTIPAAVDCINKINYWSQGEVPHILLHQPSLSLYQKDLLAENWEGVLETLLISINKLASWGADFAIIPANSVHKVITEVQKKSPIPVLDMLEVVAEECCARGIKRVGIMGTVWTMSGHLYQEKLRSREIEEVIPHEQEQEIIQRAILEELVPTGRISTSTLLSLIEIAQSLKNRGCKGIALACTELPLALNASNCPIEIIDTTEVLVKAALKWQSLVKYESLI